MCGISGIISIDPQAHLEKKIRQMNNQIAHRGPDSEGFYIQPGVALGHRRLSIIDLSAASNQPMEDASGQYSIVYNGELYNYLELKQILAKEYDFQTQGDSEVLLAAYKVWGAECLQKCNGMFAFAIWDKLNRTLFIARDRLGIKPLYYTLTDKGLCFASEMRALLTSGLIKKEINSAALVDYLSYQTVHGPNTLIDNIKMIPPGSFAYYRDGNLNIQSYWRYGEVEISQDSKESTHDNIRNLLRNAVHRRLVSDVPLGAFLSGGIDSSAIVALMAEGSRDPINTFSVVFNEKKYDESPYSQIIAKKFNTRHTPILLSSEDFLHVLPEALKAMDSPCADGANSYMVSKVTKEAGITVALSGLGGDELFAGYPIFKHWKKLKQLSFWWKLPQVMRSGMISLLDTAYPHHRNARLQALMGLNKLDFNHAYPIFRKLASQKYITQLNPNLPIDYNAVLNILQDSLEEGENIPELSKVSIGEISTYTQNVLLRDTDQMSMAHALEVRVPFFDHELVSYILGIQDKIKYPHTPKQLLTDSLGDLIPKEIIHRPKMGFVFPYEKWLKNEMLDFAEQNFKSLAERELFLPSAVTDLWSRFLKKDPEAHWVNIWNLVVLEEWLKNYAD